ncbi:hypothetical protein [Deinococcus ruber]|uniref:Uncharacterized protein n=1 Tax=Deinococcus ruber TaxID=1848197 RepID=A0A918F7V9_9DEIO|nr:hypothetical protein [Deinococcus ruber]GGR17428.1 hypothetical protein GCM10008957_32650 [Deinococcus ruber]
MHLRPASRALFLVPLAGPEWPVLICTFGEWLPEAEMHVRADADFDKDALIDRTDGVMGVFVEVGMQNEDVRAFGFGRDVPAAYRAAAAQLGFHGFPELLDETVDRLNVVLAPFGVVLSQEGSGRVVSRRTDGLWLGAHPLLVHEPEEALLDGLLNLTDVPGGQKVAPGQTQLTPLGLSVDALGRRLQTRDAWSIPCWWDDRDQLRVMLGNASPQPLVHTQHQTTWLDLKVVVWIQTHERSHRQPHSQFWNRFDVANRVLEEVGLKVTPSLTTTVAVNVVTRTGLQVAQGVLTTQGTVEVHRGQPLLETNAADAERPILNADGVAAVLGQWPGNAHALCFAERGSHLDEQAELQDCVWRTVRLWDANEQVRCRLFVGVRTTLEPEVVQAVIAEVQWLSDQLTRPAGLAVGLSAIDVAELLGTWAGCQPITSLASPAVDQDVELWGLRSLVNPQERRLTQPEVRAAVLERHLRRMQIVIESGCDPVLLERVVAQRSLLRTLIASEDLSISQPSAKRVQLPVQAAPRPLSESRRSNGLRRWWRALLAR